MLIGRGTPRERSIPTCPFHTISAEFTMPRPMTPGSSLTHVYAVRAATVLAMPIRSHPTAR